MQGEDQSSFTWRSADNEHFIMPQYIFPINMTIYVTSDHHFNHENIIEYTNRPFSNVEEMNDYMKERWNRVVSEEDPVMHIGDVAFSKEGSRPKELLSELNGNPSLIIGNHDDSINSDNFPYLCMESSVIQHHGYRFWCTHRPDNIPDMWTEWVIHGHIHNDGEFIDYDNNTINISVEKTDYTPIPIPILVKALKNTNSGQIYNTIEESPITDFEWYNQNFK
jgi:calcineurin-like phosphoesterase family protein